jgi:6-pyruvoyltetrahydropterin/6-carboxytetrahydropterin synthase
VIEAEVRSLKLQTKGVETGMVVDFGFLKQFMMSQIHDFGDHGLCLWVKDDLLTSFLDKFEIEKVTKVCENEGWCFIPEDKQRGQFKLLVVPFVPTAEHLAEFWFSRLRIPIEQHDPNLKLTRLYVWETPNSVAIFPSHSYVSVPTGGAGGASAG